MNLQGEIALVTGASRGIGRGIAIELAKEGFDVAGNGVKFDPQDKSKGLFEVQDRVEGLKAAFLPIQGDISELADHEKILGLCLKRFGRIDVLVNNAGIAARKRVDILETAPETYDRVMAVNARGVFFLAQRVSRQMIEQVKKGEALNPCIIFISSISAEVSSPLRAEYCISKAALSQMARLFADRLAEFGINVYEVRPGIIQTDMTASVKDKYDKLITEGLIPQQRWGYPEDVARAVAALAKGYFSYSTGMVIEVSGGLNIRRL